MLCVFANVIPYSGKLVSMKWQITAKKILALDIFSRIERNHHTCMEWEEQLYTCIAASRNTQLCTMVNITLCVYVL